MDELIVLSGPMKGRHFPIEKDTIRFGRERSCEVVLDDEASSRQHCEIYRKDGRLHLKDLSSTNGTFLNNSRVGESPLNDGDKIVVGDTVMYVRIAPDEGSGPAPAVVFADDDKAPKEGTRVSLRMDPTRFLDLKEELGASAAARFAELYDFTMKVSPLLHKDALLERAMDLIFRAIPADRGVLMLTNTDGAVETKVVRKRSGVEEGKEITVSKTLLSEVLEKHESFLTVDAQADERLAASESIANMSVRSVLCSPLKLQDRVLGLVYLDTVGRSRAMNQIDLRLLTAMAIMTTVCLENARLYGELMDAVEYNTSILRGLNSGLLVVNTRGVVTKVNETALEILRLTERSLVGRRLSDHTELAEVIEVVGRTLATGVGLDRSEARVKVADDLVPLGLSVSPLKDHAGAVVGAVANFRSLASIRRLEEQVKRSQHLAGLGQMAAGVAHEIRNPLNSIRGFAQLLQENPTDERAQEYAGIILEEVDRMNEIVQGLLDFSRQRELTLVTTDVVAVVRGLLTDMKKETDSARVESGFSTDAETMTVLGNGLKLRQVFSNIVLNAVQAMPNGGKLGVNISRRATGENDEEGRRREVAVAISDTGIGIPPDILPKIFDPFFTNKEVGTGLGLSISQKIVDQHGGRIEVATEVGKGSTFTVFLPTV